MQVKDAHRNRRNVGVLVVVCLVLQVAVSSIIALGNGRANFMFICAATVALTVGGRTGVLIGFIAGIIFDLSSTGPIGLMAFLLTLTAFILGIGERDRLADDSMSASFYLAIACLVVSLAYHLTMFVFGQAASIVDLILLRVLPTAFLTCIAAVPFVFVLGRKGNSGISTAHGRHVGRYSIDGR